jgi:hypothetical protein
MTDIARQRYERLMAQIADLEERVETLEQDLATGEGVGDAQDAAVLRQELKDLTEQLARERSELSRISDGCGRPHPMQ